MNKFKDILDYLYYERKKIIIIFIILTITIPFLLFITKKEDDKEEIILEEKKEEIEVISNKVSVDIKGEVKNPGYYEIDSDKRIKDLIDMAGGLTDEASTDDINLSSKVYDEMVIVINKKEEVKEEVTNSPSISVSKSNNSSSTKPSGKISINTAGISELITLNGIKEARAKKIIEYRETNGPFKSIEEIKNVSGIGEGIFAKIKDYITL